MLKRIILATAVLIAAPASAGDTWTGFHVGINAGYGAGQFRTPMSGTFNSPPNTYNLSGDLRLNGGGFVGGGQAGYDYLLPSNWLIGFEADAQATTINPELIASGPLGNVGSYDLSFGTSLDFLGTARARVGYVVPESNLLFYGTAGLAYGGVGVNAAMHVRNATDRADITLDRFSVDVGWAAGAGIECPVTDKLSLRAEYLYADLGSHTVVNWQLQAPTLTGSGTMKIETAAHIGRIALNYALN